MLEGLKVARRRDDTELNTNHNDKEPQITADERRYVHIVGFSEIIHRKGRKECKAVQQESLCPLCSLWLILYSAPAHERAPRRLRLPFIHAARGDRHGGR